MPRIERVKVEAAEAGRKIALLHRRQRLLREEQHEVLVERVANRRDIVVGKRAARSSCSTIAPIAGVRGSVRSRTRGMALLRFVAAAVGPPGRSAKNKGDEHSFRTFALVATGAAAASVGTASSVLPNGWALRATSDPVVQTGTMPQGAAISSDGSTLAILESGFNPPALALYATPSLRLLKRVSLTGAFGRPVWTDSGIFVAGANADALFVVDPKTHNVRKIALPKNSYPIAVAARNGTVAVATDGDGAVRMGSLDALPRRRRFASGLSSANSPFQVTARSYS